MVDIGLRKRFRRTIHARPAEHSKRQDQKGSSASLPVCQETKGERCGSSKRMTQELVTWDQEAQGTGRHRQERDVRRSEHSGKRGGPGRGREPFESLGAFVKADHRKARTIRHGIAAGEDSEYIVPTSVWLWWLSVAPSASVMRPGATVVPPGDYPDAKVEDTGAA